MYVCIRRLLTAHQTTIKPHHCEIEIAVCGSAVAPGGRASPSARCAHIETVLLLGHIRVFDRIDRPTDPKCTPPPSQTSPWTRVRALIHPNSITHDTHWCALGWLPGRPSDACIVGYRYTVRSIDHHPNHLHPHPTHIHTATQPHSHNEPAAAAA